MMIASRTFEEGLFQLPLLAFMQPPLAIMTTEESPNDSSHREQYRAKALFFIMQIKRNLLHLNLNLSQAHLECLYLDQDTQIKLLKKVYRAFYNALIEAGSLNYLCLCAQTCAKDIFPLLALHITDTRTKILMN